MAGHHCMLYYNIQRTKKYSILMCYFVWQFAICVSGHRKMLQLLRKIVHFSSISGDEFQQHPFQNLLYCFIAVHKLLFFRIFLKVNVWYMFRKSTSPPPLWNVKFRSALQRAVILDWTNKITLISISWRRLVQHFWRDCHYIISKVES